MAYTSRHGCTYGGGGKCPELLPSGTARCEKHRTQERRAAESRRRSASARGYDRAWQQASRAFLATHPLCVYCSTPQRPVAAECVDHIQAHKGDQRLFNDRSNWAASCLSCNSAKAVREEGAFGMRRTALTTRET